MFSRNIFSNFFLLLLCYRTSYGSPLTPSFSLKKKLNFVVAFNVYKYVCLSVCKFGSLVVGVVVRSFIHPSIHRLSIIFNATCVHKREGMMIFFRFFFVFFLQFFLYVVFFPSFFVVFFSDFFFASCSYTFVIILL